jgi:[ribosomal protein S5]-alanine N-acetyltransferase
MNTAIQISTLETPALIVREVRKDDMRDFAGYMLRNDYQQHLASRYSSIAEVQAFVARCLRRQSLPNRRGYYLAAELKATQHVVGDGFVVVHGGKTAEVGWGLHPDLWGRGFATELARALLCVGFEKLKCQKIWAKSFSENRPSMRVMEKIGMKHDQLVRDQRVAPGLSVDVSYWVLSAEQYFEASYAMGEHAGNT